MPLLKAHVNLQQYKKISNELSRFLFDQQQQRFCIENIRLLARACGFLYFVFNWSKSLITCTSSFTPAKKENQDISAVETVQIKQTQSFNKLKYITTHEISAEYILLMNAGASAQLFSDNFQDLVFQKYKSLKQTSVQVSDIKRQF